MPKRKTPKSHRNLPFLLLLFIGVSCIAAYTTVRMLSPIRTELRENGITLPVLMSLITKKNPPLRSEKNTVNVLLLGIPGGEHEGANLTDTMLLLSLHVPTKDAVLVSIPRDIWLPSLNTRINVAYEMGEEKKPGGGIQMARSAISEVTGQPVQYVVLFDFSGFVRIIDLIGGIDVTVEKRIDDPYYPIPGKEQDVCNGDPALSCRYEHLVIEQGAQHMSGEQALKYVRSRQSEGDEGTDFARSKRQQKVIAAVREKVFSLLSIQNRTTLLKLEKELNTTVKTDMNRGEQLLLFQLFLGVNTNAVQHISLDTGDEKNGKAGLLINPSKTRYNGAWVLVPKTGTFDEIHRYLSCQIYSEECPEK